MAKTPYTTVDNTTVYIDTSLAFKGFKHGEKIKCRDGDIAGVVIGPGVMPGNPPKDFPLKDQCVLWVMFETDNNKVCFIPKPEINLIKLPKIPTNRE